MPVKMKNNVNSGVILAHQLGCLRGLEATDWKAWKPNSPMFKINLYNQFYDFKADSTVLTHKNTPTTHAWHW